MYTFSLHVGNKIKKFKIPFNNVVLGKTKEDVKVLGNIDFEVKKSLEKLIGIVDTSKINSKSKILIVSDDYTRPTPTKDILPELLNFLFDKNVRKENIKIIVATGFHREMTPKEKIDKFGEKICSNYEIIHHNSLDKKSLTYIGKTKNNIPIYINKLATDADFIIGIGIVEIHPWAGFAGGPKIICPGIAGKETINYTHALPVIEKNVEIGKTTGNPFWENIKEAAKLSGLDMVINILLDQQGKISAIYSGEAVETQKKCIDVFKKNNCIFFKEEADIVITTSDPKFHYWGQAAISGYNADSVVKKGGTRIIIAECPEGFGDSQHEIIFYFDSLRDEWEDLSRYWEEKKGKMFDNSRNACAIHRHLLSLKKSDMLMVTKGFPSSTPTLKSQKVVSTFQEAINITRAKYGDDAKVIIYDLGAMVLPLISK